jgi:hypothetical protein
MPLPENSPMSLEDYNELQRLKLAAEVAKKNLDEAERTQNGLDEARRLHKEAMDEWNSTSRILRTKYFT